MQHEELEELLACLPTERTLYLYSRDLYAAQLLGIAARRYPTIPAVKRSPFRGLLDKPTIRPLIRRCGSGALDTDTLAGYWSEPGAMYLLTAGRWGSDSGCDNQTSRPGYNLVLRLNFNASHDRSLMRWICPRLQGVFNHWGHPILEPAERPYFRETLAWARLDIDLAHDEVLVEEIQSDWVRYVATLAERVAACSADDTPICGGDFRTTAAKARRYLGEIQPLLGDWSQAMLSAVVDFVDRELGVSTLWYHTWECGNCLKQIHDRRKPPRSLYTRLPRQFCFEQTDAMPSMLARRSTRRRLQRGDVAARFFRLSL